VIWFLLRVECWPITNGWQPDQLNEIYRLNLKNLIGGTDRRELSLVDPRGIRWRRSALFWRIWKTGTYRKRNANRH
jgi:hypothetical protein